MDKYIHEEARLKMAHRARSFAIASLIAAVVLFSIPYIAIGLGFMAILFAILSKGYKSSIDKDAKVGVVVATISIAIGVSVIGSVFYKLKNDDAYRNTLFSIINEYYGDEYSELFKESFPGLFDGIEGGDFDVNV